MELADLVRVHGVPESALDAEVAERLGANQAPAPWQCLARSVLWFGRGGVAAARAVAPSVGRGGRALGVIGGMVQYFDTPVGSYAEVFGAAGIRNGRRVVGSVPFMAVDSETSLVGGRTNWALPKTLATFEGAPEAGKTMTAQGRDWHVQVTARALGPAVPMPTLSTALAQQWPDGSVGLSSMRAWGRVRPAIVTVEIDAPPTLSGWLRPGRHVGAVFESMEFTLGQPQKEA
ncbi:acetoacetate decarboxylase family protein [Hoyosella altamirensis]|uniref:Acetoacetate decarboxylase n=1 Tax=Hoyosella altamirensis TaxID=616997 RepID=A0A839RLJ8_9ACTN|nr:acetoacetate decarboxylase family protein [Hoyosella altamirensis]MBB3037370.1 hypothetical protein [Hoyosella altamirensis]